MRPTIAKTQYNKADLKYFRIITDPDNTDINYPFRINLKKENLIKIKKIINID